MRLKMMTKTAPKARTSKSPHKRRYPKNIKPKRKDGSPEVATLLRWASEEEKQYVARAAQSLDVSLSNFSREAAISRANAVLPPVASPTASLPA